MIETLNPELCLPPHRITHWEKFEFLKSQLKKGWKRGTPVLIGYPFSGKIQLISGSHRWHAAMELGISIPVWIVTWSYLEEIWGTDEWIHFIKNPPVFE